MFAKNLLSLVLALASLSFVHAAQAGAYHQTGKIRDLSITNNGLLVKFEPALPDNCEDTPYGWMVVKQEDTALTSALLALWISDRLSGTIYTKPPENGTKYCSVSQFHPAK